jgi:hypothetical protein
MDEPGLDPPGLTELVVVGLSTERLAWICRPPADPPECVLGPDADPPECVLGPDAAWPDACGA